jgi:hypothetical protein
MKAADALNFKYPTPSVGDALLVDVEAFFRRYVHFTSEAQAVAVALWTVHTHAMAAADLSPYLYVSSPEKRAGKSTLLKLLRLVVARPWVAVTPTEAVVFRKLERDKPTLLLDEVDAVFGPKAGEHEGLRAILNSGFERGTPVPRCVAPKFDVQEFDVFGPKALAGIGRLPDTVADRSVPVRLQRKRAGEQVARFRRREVAAEAEPIAARLAEWAAGVVDTLAAARPALPDELNDRAADAWEPLLAIADAVGGDWPRRARQAAVLLSTGSEVEDESIGVRLLADVRDVLADVKDGHGRVATKALLGALYEVEESPWSDLRGKPLSAERLARYLRPYGLRSRQLRSGAQKLRGFVVADFEDVFARYLPQIDGSTRYTRYFGSTTPETGDSEPGTGSDLYRVEKPDFPHNQAVVPGVPGSGPKLRAERPKTRRGVTITPEDEELARRYRLDGGVTLDFTGGGES